MLAIWNEFAHFVSDAAPAFAVGLMLSAGVQWLVARSHWAARALSWVAQSVPGAALAGAALPGCSMTTVPLAIPLKRQGAGDGPLLAFIITSALLGPASIHLHYVWPCKGNAARGLAPHPGVRARLGIAAMRVKTPLGRYGH